MLEMTQFNFSKGFMGHSKTTWTNFCTILATYLPMVDFCGHLVHYLPFVHVDIEKTNPYVTDNYIPSLHFLLTIYILKNVQEGKAIDMYKFYFIKFPMRMKNFKLSMFSNYSSLCQGHFVLYL